jgi:hypothetical protein
VHTEFDRATLATDPYLNASPDEQASNIPAICRMLQLKAASTPSEEILGYKRQLIETLPRKTDLADKTKDTCLICSESIPFDVQVEQVAPALCPRKHVWGKSPPLYHRAGSLTLLIGRCSITYRLITTPFVRTCSTCHTKALLPDPKKSADAWSIEQDLLLAATSCPRCGGLWRCVV